MTEKQRQRILERDGHRCGFCDSEKRLEIHHEIPKEYLSDPDNPRNLTTYCHDCHVSYGLRPRHLHTEARMRLWGKPYAMWERWSNVKLEHQPERLYLDPAEGGWDIDG